MLRYRRGERSNLTPASREEAHAGRERESASGGRFRHRDQSGRRGTAVVERRALLLDGVIEQPVVAGVDETVVVEIAVGVAAGIRYTDVEVEDAEVAGVDLPVEVRVPGVRVHRDD